MRFLNIISRKTNPIEASIAKQPLSVVLCAGLAASGLLAWFGGVWLAAPSGFLFGVWLPGILVYLLIKRQFVFGWVSSLLSVGLGLASLIFVTLVDNWVLCAVGVSSPLRPGYIFGAVTLFSISVFTIGHRRWHADAFVIGLPKLNKIDIGTIAVSILFVLAVIAGAIQLNNGGSGGIATGCFIALPLLVLWLLVMRRRLRVGSIIFVLWLAGLGVLLAGWLRGGYIAGPDVSKEFLVFQLAKDGGVWDIGAYRDAYNACLSVNLLPVALSHLTKIPDMLVFKLLIPAIYSLIVPIVFLLAREKVKTFGAILATVFFISQPPFSVWWWIPIRQQVALFFFGLCLLVLVKLRREKTSLLLFITFAAAMIVSHYSTAYTAIGLMLLLIASRAVLQRLNRSLDLPALPIRLTTVVVMLLVTFMWYSQVTYGFSNIGQFLSKSVQNVGLMFSDEVQQPGQSVFDRFNIFSRPGQTTSNALEYEKIKKKVADKEIATDQRYTTNLTPQLPTYNPFPSLLATKLELSRNIFKVLGNALLAGGVVLVMVISWRQRRFSAHSLVQISAFALMGAALILPFFSISYGPDRLYLQLLLVMASAVVFTFELPKLRPVSLKMLRGTIAVFLIGYFLLLNQVPLQFTQTPQRNWNFSNSGAQCEAYCIARQDAAAAKWLANERQPQTPIYGDSFSLYRLSAGTDLALISKHRTGVLISGMTKNSYIYQAAINTATKTGFDRFEGGIIRYEFPEDFLSANKNTVYSNGAASIYR